MSSLLQRGYIKQIKKGKRGKSCSKTIRLTNCILMTNKKQGKKYYSKIYGLVYCSKTMRSVIISWVFVFMGLNRAFREGQVSGQCVKGAV